MNLSAKISLNTLASSVGRVGGSFLGLISIGLITRALGREGFGEYSTVLAYLATFQILADLGLYALLTKEISQKSEDENNLVSLFFTLRLVVAAFFLSIGAAFVFFLPYSIEVKIAVVFVSSAFLFMSLTQILMSIFQKYLQTYKNALVEIIGRAVQLGLVWFFFHAGGGFYHYMAALVAASFVIFALNLFFAWRLVRFRLMASISRWRHILRTTFPIAISLVFTLLYFKVDTILLSLLQTQEAVGIYSIAYKVLETFIFFPAAFVGLLLPILAKYAKENREKFSKLVSVTSDLMGYAAFPLVAGGILLSSSLVHLIGGDDFLISTPTLQVLFLAIGIIFYGTLFGTSIIALGLQKKALWAYVAGFLFNFIANLVFIPRYSYLGAAWTTVVTEILVTLVLIWVVRREVFFSFSLSHNVKTASAAVLMGGGIFYFARPITEPLSALMFLTLVIFGGIIYFVFSYVMRISVLQKIKTLA